jgi:hypothetical protein
MCALMFVARGPQMERQAKSDVFSHGVEEDCSGDIPARAPVPLASQLRAPHCREDLPGCCPRVVKHVVLLHSPKTGGASLRQWLTQALAHVPDIAARNKYAAAAEGASYACVCSAVFDMVAKKRGFFDESDFVAFHGDVSVLRALKRYDPDAFRETLVVVTTRKPIQRAVSLYHHFKHGPGLSDEQRHSVGGTLSDFFNTGLGYGMPNFNPMTRSLSTSDICAAQCAQGRRAQQSSRKPASENNCTWRHRYDAALDFLQNDVCAVFVSEKAAQSVEVLADALGIPVATRTKLPNLLTVNSYEAISQAPALKSENAAPVYEAGASRVSSGVWDVDPQFIAAFNSYNAWDNALYDSMLARLDQSSAAAAVAVSAAAAAVPAAAAAVPARSSKSKRSKKK